MPTSFECAGDPFGCALTASKPLEERVLAQRPAISFPRQDFGRFTSSFKITSSTCIPTRSATNLALPCELAMASSFWLNSVVAKDLYVLVGVHL